MCTVSEVRRKLAVGRAMTVTVGYFGVGRLLLGIIGTFYEVLVVGKELEMDSCV